MSQKYFLKNAPKLSKNLFENQEILVFERILKNIGHLRLGLPLENAIPLFTCKIKHSFGKFGSRRIIFVKEMFSKNAPKLSKKLFENQEILVFERILKNIAHLRLGLA